MLSYGSRGPAGACGAVLLLSAAGLLAFAAACSSLNDEAGSQGFTEGGPFDSGGDTSSEGSPPDGGSPTTALFVQASPSLPDVRLCWASSGTLTTSVPFPGGGVMPGSNYPGVPLGGVAALSDATPLLGADLTLYAIDAENLARLEQPQLEQGIPESTCDKLICPSQQGSNPNPPCLRYNFDYWPISTIAGGSVREGMANVVALGGCFPSALDPNATATRCGPSWSALAGNLGAQVLQLRASTATGTELAVQTAQLSPGLAALVGEGGTAVVTFGPQGGADASTVATVGSEGALSTPSLVSIGSSLSAYGQLGFGVDVLGFDGGAGHLWMSLAEAQQLVDPNEDPTLFFGQPRTYLLAVLGDPDATHAFATGDASYDGTGLHVLVIAAPPPPVDAGDAGDR